MIAVTDPRLRDGFDEFNILSGNNNLRDVVDRYMMTDDPMPLQHHLIGVLLSQMSAKQGIKKYGMKAKEVLFTEFLQLCDIDTFMPVHKDDLNNEQIRQALIAISVIKENKIFNNHNIFPVFLELENIYSNSTT